MSPDGRPRTSTDSPGASIPLTHHSAPAAAPINQNRPSTTDRGLAHDEIVAAGVREVVVFHSNADALREFQADLPFATIAHPDKELYRGFGVEASPKALLSPRAWVAATRGMKAQSLRGAAGIGEKHLGLPADFLIDSGRRVVAVKYGRHADDQWSVDGLLELVGATSG